MQALRASVRRGRSNVWVTQKRFGEGSWVPADIPVVLQKKKSVDTVATLTSTMRNVAAGKLPSCQNFLSATRPFAAVTGPMMETESPPPTGIKKHLHLVVGCERGLCGVVGANLPKNVTKLVRDANKNNPDVENEVVIIGKKTTSKLRATLGTQVTHGYTTNKTKMPTYATCLEITDHLMKTREFDRCTLYYNVFKNISQFYPDQIDTYSLALSTQIAEMQFPQYDVEGDERTIIQNLQEFKFASTLYNCMSEQLASEMASRLASMEGASKNCQEKSKEYFTIYQKLRKQKITNELTVLSVGAKLAKKK